jgi:hypothetical protein
MEQRTQSGSGRDTPRCEGMGLRCYLHRRVTLTVSFFVPHSSAQNVDERATLYNLVGVVKRHAECLSSGCLSARVLNSSFGSYLLESF